jgi:hypothetical protein
MTDEVRTQSRSLVAAMIVALEAQRRDLQDELDVLRSTLRNDLVGERWTDGRYRVEFRLGRYRAVPSCRTSDGGIIFRRRRLEPYMKVSAK